jgi:hypothetical protein|tara:strand:+ start:1252 stop:1404 length:153 start_codon:yes stop_codon:yes gene_type:complete
MGAQDDIVRVLTYSVDALQKEVKRLKDENEFLQAKIDIISYEENFKNNNN